MNNSYWKIRNSYRANSLRVFMSKDFLPVIPTVEPLAWESVLLSSGGRQDGTSRCTVQLCVSSGKKT